MNSIQVTTIISVVILALCSNHGLAFHLSMTAGKGRTAVRKTHAISRRAALATSSFLLFPLPPSHASTTSAVIGGATQSARVETWPGIEGLEPMYELKLSIDAISSAVSDPTNWPSIKKRLDTFFSGFLVNEKNFYVGIGLQYMNEMQYDKGELPNYVVLDKQARFDALDRTMKDLESLKASLDARDTAAIESYAKSSQNALASWFSLIPASDVKAAADLFVSIRKADSNRDGILSDGELVFMSVPEQELWKRRVDKVGFFMQKPDDTDAS